MIAKHLLPPRPRLQRGRGKGKKKKKALFVWRNKVTRPGASLVGMAGAWGSCEGAHTLPSPPTANRPSDPSLPASAAAATRLPDQASRDHSVRGMLPPPSAAKEAA
ncbi:hypothetical protein GQ53DRAFT_55500 [Thozetella sp. PMI_491]|nr:hypothetical protein GQ53DRAFT_55500 [Thozetella sp. PMI_491]